MTDPDTPPSSPSESPRSAESPKDESGIPLEAPVTDKDAIELEPVAEATPGEVGCPSCGASMPGDETLVCLRCGYDLKTMSAHDTDVATDELEAPPELSGDGLGSGWLPLTLTLVSIAALVVGYLAGQPSLFPRLVAAAEDSGMKPITGGQRAVGVVQMLGQTGLWSIAGILGLGTLAWQSGARIGNVEMAIFRIIAIAAVTRVVAFVGLGGGPGEWMVEALAQIALALGCLMAWFNLSAKNAGWFLGIAGLIFLACYGGARAIVFVT